MAWNPACEKRSGSKENADSSEDKGISGAHFKKQGNEIAGQRQCQSNADRDARKGEAEGVAGDEPGDRGGRGAPAMRMPISCVRAVTEWESTP